jgi:hypothetical protein
MYVDEPFIIATHDLDCGRAFRSIEVNFGISEYDKGHIDSSDGDEDTESDEMESNRDKISSEDEKTSGDVNLTAKPSGGKGEVSQVTGKSSISSEHSREVIEIDSDDPTDEDTEHRDCDDTSGVGNKHRRSSRLRKKKDTSEEKAFELRTTPISDGTSGDVNEHLKLASLKGSADSSSGDVDEHRKVAITKSSKSTSSGDVYKHRKVAGRKRSTSSSSSDVDKHRKVAGRKISTSSSSGDEDEHREVVSTRDIYYSASPDTYIPLARMPVRKTNMYVRPTLDSIIQKAVSRGMDSFALADRMLSLEHTLSSIDRRLEALEKGE